MDENVSIRSSRYSRKSFVQAEKSRSRRTKDSKCTHVPSTAHCSFSSLFSLLHHYTRISFTLALSVSFYLFSPLPSAPLSVSWVYIERSFSSLRRFSPIYVKYMYAVGFLLPQIVRYSLYVFNTSLNTYREFYITPTYVTHDLYTHGVIARKHRLMRERYIF